MASERPAQQAELNQDDAQRETPSSLGDGGSFPPRRRPGWFARLLPGGIRQRLYLLIALALVPLLILQGWLYYRHYAIRRHEAMQTEVEVAQGVATTFVSYLNDIRRQLNTTGQAIITFSTYTEAKTTHLLQAVEKQYPTILNVSWVDPQGIIQASSLPGLVGRDLSGREYFQQIRTGQSWALGNLMPQGSVTESPLFVIASAIEDDQGLLHGVVAAAIEPTRLGVRTFAAERPAQGAYAIFDHAGNLVYCSPETALTWEQRTKWRQADPLLQQSQEGQVARGFFRSPLTGGRRLAARVPIAGIDWVAGASRPVRVAMGPVWLALIQEAGFGLLVTLSAFLLAYFIARTIADPLRRLEREARALGEGRIESAGGPDGPTEVGRLHATMTRMATDLIHRAESLRRSEERYRKLFQADLVGVYVTKPDGTFLDCNEKIVSMLGYDSREEVLRHRSTDFYVDPHFREEAVQTLLRDGIFPGREGLLRRKDGTTIHALGFAVLLTDEQTGEPYIQGVAVDVTELQRTEQALRESEAKFRSVFEQAAIGMGRVCFATARWIDVNDAFCRMLGYSPEELRATPWPEITHPDDIDLDMVPFRRMAAGELESYTVEKRFIHKQGHHIWARLTLSLVRDAQGRPDYEIAIIEDITARKQAEQSLHELTATLESRVAERTAELEQRARQLQKMTLELSQTEDRERKRLADILHDDLQQQLAAVKFHLGLLRKHAQGDPALQEAVAPVETMIKDAIAKSRSLSHELSPAPLYHGDFGETISWLAGQVHTKYGLVIHTDVRGQVEIRSDAIKAFLFRAAREILFNIVKHADVKQATVRLRRRRGQLWLSVCDKGRGFDPGSLGQVGGFGLLSIRERIELLGGRMKIRSAPGRGSTFLITVPDEQAETANRPQEPVEAGPAPGERREAPLRVLLADDHKIVREGLAALLTEQQDIEVVGQAANGREAVRLARELRPDVVVMDVAMPLMEGDEATRRIKRDVPDVRVIGLSMYEEAGIAERMRRAGAERYMLKNAPAEELLAALRNL